MPKIFIVEDDENIRDLVLYALNSSGFEGAGFESGKEFFACLQSQKPDLVLMDIMLPNEDGISVLRKMKSDRNTEGIPVILISAKTKEYDKIKGLDLGADDYITKPFSLLEMISRIKAVLRRCEKKEKDVKSNLLMFESIEIDLDKRAVTAFGKKINLAFKEFELLCLLVSNPHRVLSRGTLMESVWGFDFEGESRTVDMHIKTLRQKLGEGGNLIKTVRGIGYKIGE